MSTSVKYQIPPSKQWAVLPGRLICHCKCHLFILSLPFLTAPTSSRSLSPFAFHSKPPSPLFCLLPFCLSPSYPTRGKRSVPVKVFSVSIFPREDKKHRTRTSFLQLVALRKLFRIASFQGRLANAYNPWLSAIVRHNLGHYTLSFPFRQAPTQLK